MHSDPVIAAAAAEYAALTLGSGDDSETRADPYDNHCEYARAFAQWAVEMVHSYVHDGEPLRLAQAKILLVDKYFEFHSYAPKSHKDRTSEKGHICLYHVFVEVYRKIRMKELTLAPPKIFILDLKQEEKQVPAAPALAHVPALYLGEVKER